MNLFNSDTDKEYEGDDAEDEEDNDLEEIKVQIIVKSKDIKAPTAKTLIIEPVNYKKVMETINLTVQKTLRKKIKSKDYVISYKVANAHGPSNELEDKLDFQEFLNEYKRIIVVKKRMSVILYSSENKQLLKISNLKISLYPKISNPLKIVNVMCKIKLQ